MSRRVWLPAQGGGFAAVGLVAALAGVGIPFVEGFIYDVGPVRMVVYVALAVAYLALTQAHLPSPRLAKARSGHPRAYLALAGALCFALQTTSGEPFVQPLIFVVPFMHAVFWLGATEAALVGALYTALVPLGIFLGPFQSTAAMIYPTVGYSVLMVVLYGCVRLAVGQSQQREYQARLVEVGASLTRDLRLDTVLHQVATAAHSLSGAASAVVWLRPAESDALQQAAAVSPDVDPSSSARAERSVELPLVIKGASIGVLELRGAPRDADLGQLQPFVDAAAVAIENARLYEQARLTATLAERNRLARELHDTIAQGLTAVTMHLESARRAIEADPVRARTGLDRAHELAKATLEDVRHSVWTLAAPADVPDLTAALEDLTRRHAARTGQSATFSHSGNVLALDPSAAAQALRIVQEALKNVEKHARASDVRVGAESEPDGVVRIWVQDNGVGFSRNRLSKWCAPRVRAPRPGRTRSTRKRRAVDRELAWLGNLCDGHAAAGERVSPSPPIRLLLVEDQRIVREGLRALLEDFPEVEIVGEASNGEEALTTFPRLAPDVVLMDLRMPRMDGAEATRRLLERSPRACVLVLTTYDSDEHIFTALRAGARGYLLKDASADELLAAIQSVYRGATQLAPAVAARVVAGIGSGSGPETLTGRALEVLSLVGQGRSNAEIGQVLSIAPQTVKVHVQNSLGKLGVSNRTEAVSVAVKQKLISL